MTAPKFKPFDRGKSESENLLMKVAVCNGVRSRAPAEVINSEGRRSRARLHTDSDTATDNSYPDKMVEDKVARDKMGESLSTTASTISLSSPALLDSSVQNVREVLNAITSTQAPSCFFSRKGDMAACLDEPNDYTVKAMVAGIIAAQSEISDTSATVGTADPRTELDTHANMCVLNIFRGRGYGNLLKRKYSEQEP